MECRGRKSTANQINSLKEPLSHAEKSLTTRYNFIACHFKLLNTAESSFFINTKNAKLKKAQVSKTKYHITNRTTRYINSCGQRSPPESTKKRWCRRLQVTESVLSCFCTNMSSLVVKQRYL